MPELSALLFARIQFGFTIAFHILFPAITIGLASFLVVLEAAWLRTNKGVYLDLYQFWLKIFAINFGMGVVSGIVMSYQFGTNWSRLSDYAGSVLGPLLTYEVLTAFFLEAGFLGVMLFGRRRVGPGLHFFATLMVALGTLLSATWILAANSWMQTPAGYQLVDGRLIPTDWWAVIFNPSFPCRLTHMVTAAFLATALAVTASGARHLLRGNDSTPVRRMFSLGLWMVLLLSPLQLWLGDRHGLNTLHYQPAKIASIEGHWENHPGEGVPLLLFGWPDMAHETTRLALPVPHLASLILTHDPNGQFPGLKEFPRENRPYAPAVFWSFRLMVALGLLMIMLGFWGAWLRWRGRWLTSRPFLRFALWMGPSGLVALIAGWITTEMGRQPWAIQGLMRTRDAVSPHGPLEVGLTLALFLAIYFAVFGTGIGYLLRLIRIGPHAGERLETEHGGPGQERHPMRPLSIVTAPKER
jgi:cytochrome d ubiquinol oxidase subunit I